MNRKHAIVIALSFVLVGMMFFSVDIPNISNHQTVSQSLPSPQEVNQIADEPDSSGKMLMNVNENPSFEDWSGSRADTYNWGHATTYRDCDFAYHGPGVTDNYGLLMEVESSGTHAAEGLVQNQNTISSTALVEPGISLSLNWNTLLNEPYADGARVYIEVQTWDGGSTFRNLHYILSGNNPISNGSIDAWFYLNDTLNGWHSFDRNLTADYIAVWGAGDLNSNQYVRLFRMHVFSNAGDAGLVRTAWDNVVLTNGTYSSWIPNGNFETGTQSQWSASESSMAYLEQSTDSMHETYSMNMSAPDCTDGGASIYTHKDFDYPASYFASSPGMMYIDIDWKYSDTDTVYFQNGRLTLTFSNTTGFYNFYLFFGTMTGTLSGWTNSTNYFSFKMPGFGVKDAWQHSRFDFYDYLSSVGVVNVSLYMAEFVIQNYAVGESMSLLVDNFQITTYPLGDPGFEEDWYMTAMTPFAGWAQYNGDATEIQRTTDSFLGNYACNLTGLTVASVGIYRTAYIPLNPSDMTDFRWRLDEIGNDNAYARIRLRFGTYSLIYVLGAGSDFDLSNVSTVHNIVPESFNVTGSWNHLMVNLTADFEEAFGSSSGVVLNQIEITIFAGTNQRLSILFDEMHFADRALPVIDSVDFLPVAPMYYNTVDVTVNTHDDRSGIEIVYVDYNNGSGWYSLHATDMGGYFEATIPAHAYDTTVEFQVSVFDGSGNNALDNNGGARYSYTVGDDVIPSVSFTSPSFFDDVEGQVSVVIDAVDVGAGVAFVELYIDNGVTMPLVMNDTVAPYEYTWNTDLEDLGDYTLYTNVVDNAGLYNDAIVNVTVVDTILPYLNSPDDVEFTVGETGHVIDWDPTDVRPYGYVVYLDGAFHQFNNWNSSSEHIVIELDGLAVGTYNYTCVVVDGTINGAVDTVIVTVNAETTTTTTTTTATTLNTTTDGGDILTPLLIVAGIGVVGILLVVFVVLPKMKKT